MRTRQGCRVVLLDPSDRLLLLRVVDMGMIVVDGRPAPPTYWITAGGGLEPDESFEDAARREVFEETGIDDFTLGPALWDRELDLELQGEMLHVFERCFAGWTDRTDVAFDHHTELERQVLREHRWWTHAELTSDSCDEAFFPEQLPQLFEETIRRRPQGV